VEATAEYDTTFEAPADVWEPIIDRCLSHTKFKDVPSLEADMDNRIDEYLQAEFPDLKGEYRPCGMGERSESYDRLAFLKVIRQPKECASCRAGRHPVDFCDSGGKIFEVFRRGDKLWVWYRPGLCKDWLRVKAVKEQSEQTPVTMGKTYGFGR
jgi:hypothetical protein